MEYTRPFQDACATSFKADHSRSLRRRSRQRKPACKQLADRRHFMAQLADYCPCSEHLLNQEANRIQLVQFFRDNFIPEPHCADFAPLIWIVNAASRGLSLALNGAVNAISFCTIYRDTSNPRMLHAATKLYFDAVREARKEIGPTCDPAVSVAISYTISFCELLRCEALDDGNTLAHTIYTLSVLESSRRRPQDKILKQMSDGNMRAFTTWGLLIQRRCHLNLEMRSFDFCSRKDGEMSTLLDLSLLVTQIAGESDALCCSKATSEPEDLLNHLTEIRALEGMLYDWMVKYSVRFDIPTYWLVDAEQSGNPRVRGTKALFNMTYHFADFRLALINITFWMSLMALLQSFAKIVRAHHDKVGTYYTQYHAVEKALNGYADHLCKAMPYMGRMDHGFAARIMAIRPLHFLSLHFKEQKDWAKLAWCFHCAVDIGSIKRPA